MKLTAIPSATENPATDSSKELIQKVKDEADKNLEGNKPMTENAVDDMLEKQEALKEAILATAPFIGTVDLTKDSRS